MSEVGFDSKVMVGEALRWVAEYEKQIEEHPMAVACAERRVPREILAAFARCQWVDSSTWVPMLALAKGSMEADALREAVRMNINDEAGENGTPHVTLCKRFLQSVGVSTTYSDIHGYSPASVYPTGLMFGLAGNCSDPMMGGWLLSQEVLVPVVFRTFRHAFEAIDGVDVTYLIEHEEVDAEDHSRWIAEALEEIVVDRATAADAVAGVHMGGRATVAVIDYLYGQMLQAVQEPAVVAAV